jgi:CheY-like chemotaxis protein
MPGMSGKELAKQIKADQRISDLKLILLSSIIDAIPTSEMNEIGFETGLNKPIKMNQLLNVILKVLGMPQEQKEFESVENDNHLISFKNKRFLIVEDNLVNIKVAQITLSGLSTHVEVATNGLEAVNLFRKHPFDVILMDIRMPVMDGVEATLKIRKLEKSLNTNNPVKIIATTANTFHEDIENCMDNGMDAFLEKPFKRKDLVSILQQLL